MRVRRLRGKAAGDQLGAAALALAGYTLWVLTDTSLKFTGSYGLAPAEVIAGVGISMTSLLFGYALLRGELAVLRPKQPGRQLLRSSLDLANNFCVVIALRHLPLALFYILIFCAPMATTVLAALVLGETLTWRRASAVGLGFVGVVVAANPFGVARSGDWVGYVACMVCVAAFSANMVWSRVMAQTESWQSMTFFSGAMSAVVGSLAMLGHVQPVSGRLAGLMGAAGLFGVLGCFCFFGALKRTSASIVSQFHYSQLLTGAAIGYMIWRERLTEAMVLGAALIVVAGVYTAMHKDAVGAPVEEPWLLGEVRE